MSSRGEQDERLFEYLPLIRLSNFFFAFSANELHVIRAELKVFGKNGIRNG